MTHRDFRASAARHAARPALLASLALAACSSPTPLPPQTYIDLTLGPHLDAMKNNYCAYAEMQQQLLIGSPKANQPVTQADNSAQFDGNVSVNCSVKGSFDIVLSGALGGTMGGTLDVSGHVTPANGGSNIVASFTQNGESFVENDCTIVFMYEGGAVPVSPPIAGGRIWAHLSCPSMVNSSTQRLLSNGMTVSEICDGEADFLFDDCMH